MKKTTKALSLLLTLAMLLGMLPGVAWAAWTLIDSLSATDFDFTAPTGDLTYNGSPKAATVNWNSGHQTSAEAESVELGGITVYYKLSDADDSTYTNIAPTNAGTYKVAIDVLEATGVNVAAEKLTDALWTFTIAPLTATLIWGDTVFKYDGTNKAPDAPTIGNKVGSDAVSVNVTVDGDHFNLGKYTAQLALTGAAANNYALSVPATQDFYIYQLANNDYPWGSNMNDSTITLNAGIDVGTGSGVTPKYQWVRSAASATKPIDSGFTTNVGSETTNPYSEAFAPVNGAWYRCKITIAGQEVYTEAVQAVKPNDYYNGTETVTGESRTWTRANGHWYLSDGKVAYSVRSDYNFDVVGAYEKNGTKYMIQTTYGAQGWTPVGTGNKTGTDLLDALRFSFGEGGITFEADLKSGITDLSFGSDTQLASYDITYYSDSAALVAQLDSGVLKQIAMIGAATEAGADKDDPAFVIAVSDASKVKYWLGNWYDRQYHVFNQASGWGLTRETVKFNGSDESNVVVKAEGLDTGMTLSWVDVPDGSTVGFRFNAGTAGSIGAVSAKVDYGTEMLEVDEANKWYKVTIPDGDTPKTLYVKSDANKKINLNLVNESNVATGFFDTPSLADNADAWNSDPAVSGSVTSLTISGKTVKDLFGLNITLTKLPGSSSASLTLAPRGETETITGCDNNLHPQPVEVHAADLSATDSTVIVTINPLDNNYADKMAQEYALYDEAGTTPRSSWVKIAGNNPLRFENGAHGVSADIAEATTYTVKTRIPATESAPASLPADAQVTTSVKLTTRDDGLVILYNPNSGAAIDYSLTLGGTYTSAPTFNVGGQYTVYYRVKNTDEKYTYGECTVTVDPNVTFNANGGTLSNVAASTYTYDVGYGKKLSDAPLSLTDAAMTATGGPGGLSFAGWYTDTTYSRRWNMDEPVVSDMTLYARWANLLSVDGTNFDNAVSVQLFQGNTPVSNKQNVDVSGAFNPFTAYGTVNDAIPEGEYDLVVTIKDSVKYESVRSGVTSVLAAASTSKYANTLKTVTARVNLKASGSINGSSITLPGVEGVYTYNVSSVLDSPEYSAVVANLDAEAMQYKNDGANTKTSMGTGDVAEARQADTKKAVTLTLSLTKEADFASVSEGQAGSYLSTTEQAYRTAQNAIRSIGSSSTYEFIDMSLTKTAKLYAVNLTAENADGVALAGLKSSDQESPAALTIPTTNMLEIRLPVTTSGNTVRIYRYHGGEAKEMTKLSAYSATPAEEGYFVGEGYVVIFTKNFSTYAVGITPIRGGSSSTSATVPMSGDSSSVAIAARVSGNTAVVEKPTSAQLDKVIGTSVDTGNVVIDVSSINRGINAVTIPTDTVKAIEKAVADPSNDATGFTVKLPDGSITFDATALAAIVDQVKGNIIEFNLDSIGTGRLNSTQRNALKDLDVQAVYDAYLTASGHRISDFKGGKADVAISYTLKEDQRGYGIVVWYVAEDGALTEVPTRYSSSDRTVTFTVEHFSDYVVAYDETRAEVCPQDSSCPIAEFSDCNPTLWYHDGVHWALENKIMSGWNNPDGPGKLFAPGGDTSRAMVAQILWNLEGKPAYVGQSEYTDVSNEAWYGPAIRWASAEGIVTGYNSPVGSGRVFKPDDPVTREQLALMLYRYAQYKKIDVSVGEDTNILSYGDAFSVSSWAMSAMQWACGAGIINGVNLDGTKYLQPQNSAARAEIATMLMRFCTETAK